MCNRPLKGKICRGRTTLGAELGVIIVMTTQRREQFTIAEHAGEGDGHKGSERARVVVLLAVQVLATPVAAEHQRAEWRRLLPSLH